MEYKEEDIKVVTASASKLITSKPCWLFVGILGITIGSQNRYRIYNGRDTGGEKYFDLEVGKVRSFTLSGCIPIFFSQGLYLEFVTNGGFSSFRILEGY